MPEVSVSVRRSGSDGGTEARFETHRVMLAEKASILDALFALQRGPCPDLAFRFSCRVGMCGSCAMVVNGREQLTCSTLIKTVGTNLRIEPLRNLPVVRDLAVNLKPFFSAYQRAIPQFIPRDDLDQNSFYPIPHDSREWNRMEHQPQCIDCGACYSACTLVTLSPRYLGPMALHRALNLIVDPRDKAGPERLKVVGGETGAFRCHTLGNCREVCPRGISPTHSIERLKRLASLDFFRTAFSKLIGRA
ncbi:MAG TPA: succinate dehydrogenase/fumarate reductase iron-sulfur subunit [Candidatus Dormibacteraeota bacterium]|nr:succinate dehydrogenase/fumarate reductase iron-sulfur subunit [Candidatus Dormibacteraeota bacterium]